MPYTIYISMLCLLRDAVLWLCRNERKILLSQFCIQREPKSLWTWATVALHCVDSGEIPHTEGSIWLRDLSHRVPTLAISVLSSSFAVHSFTNTKTHNNTYYQNLNSNFFLTLYIRYTPRYAMHVNPRPINTLWTGDADLRLYITTVQDGWSKSAFLTRAWFPRTIHSITQYMEHFSEWSCWRMFIEGRVFGEYFLKISFHQNS